MYSDAVMLNKLDEATDADLVNVLLTLDGRGKENKRKALDILLKKVYDMGKTGQPYTNLVNLIPKKE